MSDRNLDLGEFAAQVALLKEAVAGRPPAAQVEFVRGYLASIRDPVTRQALEDMFLLGQASVQPARRHVIALVHGIRTRALWFEPLAATLRQVPNVTPKGVSYGYFDLIRFLIPGLREAPVKHLKEQLALLARDNPDASLSVIAHSFGTYAVARLLDEEAGLRIHRVVLCGAIVPPRFKWHRTSGIVDKLPILNECGTRDVWPVFAKTMTWGYGPSGTYGAESIRVLDRYHNLDHSGFFSIDFYQRWWVPLWSDPDSDPEPSPDCAASPWLITLVSWIPVKWIALAALLAMILIGAGPR